MDPNIVDAGVAWFAGEVARHALLYLPWLLVLGVGAVLGILMFGRGYKKRIRELERKIALLEREGGTASAPVESASVVIHGDLQVIENQYNSTDGQYHAEVEGRAKIVSPVPVRLTAAPAPIKDIGQSDLKPPPKDDLWKVNPGAGRIVARAITQAESLEDAHAIFDVHYASPNPKDTAWAAHVLLMRMEAAGENVMPLIHKLFEDGIDMTEHLDAINQEIGDGHD